MGDNLEIKVLKESRRPLDIRVGSQQPYREDPTTQTIPPFGSIVAWGSPEKAHIRAYLERNAYSQMMAHARSGAREGQRVEVGGILLGRAIQSSKGEISDVIISEALPDEHGISRPSTFNFTFESWAALIKEAETRFPKLRIVGWYHSHPDFGVFFSGTDRESQKTYFSNPWRVGIVVDPIRDEGKLFTVSPRTGEVEAVEGFFEPIGPNGQSWISWRNWTASAPVLASPLDHPHDATQGATQPRTAVHEAVQKGILRRPIAWIGARKPLVFGLAAGLLVACSLLFLISSAVVQLRSDLQNVQATVEAIGVDEHESGSTVEDSSPNAEDDVLPVPSQTLEPSPTMDSITPRLTPADSSPSDEFDAPGRTPPPWWRLPPESPFPHD